MSKEAMKLALEAAYLAGFNASGEGYNGEYPFRDHARNPEEDAAWIKDRDNAIREALAEQPAPMIRGDIRDGLVDDEPAQRKPLIDWIAVSERIPLESDGEVLVRMRDGRCEIAWATYWHGSSNAFAQWTFRDPDEDEAPTHWMPIPAAHGIKGGT